MGNKQTMGNAYSNYIIWFYRNFGVESTYKRMETKEKGVKQTMNQLLASIMVALGIAKVKEKSEIQTKIGTVKSKHVFPRGYEHLGVEIAERRQRERRRLPQIPIGTIIAIVGFIIPIAFGAYALTGGFSGHPAKSAEQIQDEAIDALSCAGLKSYYESHFDYNTPQDSQNNLMFRAWMEYNGKGCYDTHKHTCHGLLGYLKGDETRIITDINCSSLFKSCDTFFFPRQDSDILFPHDWFYFDNSTNTKITDPNTYLQMMGKPIGTQQLQGKIQS